MRRQRPSGIDSPQQAQAIFSELVRASGAQVIAQRSVPGHGAGCFASTPRGQIAAAALPTSGFYEVPFIPAVSSLRVSCHDEPLVAASAERLSRQSASDGGRKWWEFRKPVSGPAAVFGSERSAVASACAGAAGCPVVIFRRWLGRCSAC